MGDPVLNVDEELGWATKLAGYLFLIGGLTAVLMLFVPGVEHEHWHWNLASAPPCLAYGLYCLFFARPDGHGLWYWHLPAAGALVVVTIAVAASGGAGSPARFYLVFVMVYVCYFFRERQARPYVLGCVAVALTPLVYDRDAIGDGYIGELLVLGPAYVLLGGLIITGKSQLVTLRERARVQSLRDPLTDLPNRRAMVEWLGEHAGDSGAVGLMLVDLDGFKDVNTVHGFPAGDAVLRETARALERCVRTDDLVARLGGDEFAVLAPAADFEGMRGLSEDVLEAMRGLERRLGLLEVEITASVGWALYPSHADSVDALIATADFCLRGAKLTGKDRSLSALEWAA